MTEHDYPYIERMQQVVEQHGEVHAVLEEHDSAVLEEHDSFEDGHELEVRKGTASFDYGTETITVEGADTTHFVHMDRVVRYYPPMEASH